MLKEQLQNRIQIYEGFHDETISISKNRRVPAQNKLQHATSRILWHAKV
jgi:hypothetical protein